jgi:UDPglucose 6-dehydrogenase
MYEAFNRNHEKIMFMDPRSAELTKYAANAMLATKISFINEIANMAEALGADAEMIRKGIGADPRIGYQFIYPGAGYGGSCFPKDLRALISTAEENQLGADILAAVEATNNAQKKKLFELITSRFGADLSGRTIGLWGLSFKPNTDDMREAPSIALIENAIAAGATIQAFDPEAMEVCAELFGDQTRLHYCPTKEAAITGADCLVICTEWRNFWSPDFQELKDLLKTPVIFDGRNLYDPAFMQELNIEYFGIGRGLTGQIYRSFKNKTPCRAA